MSRASSAVMPATGSAAACGEAHLVGQDARGRASAPRRAAPSALSCERRRRALPRAGRCRRRRRARTVAGEVPAGEACPAACRPARLTSPRLSEMASTATSASLGSGSGRAPRSARRPDLRRKSEGEHRAGPYRSGFAGPRCENRRHGPARPPGPGRRCLRRAPARVGGRVALAAGGALVAGAARRGPRTTAGCARRCSATATGSCTPRPSGASSTRRRSSSRPRATTTARG